MDQKSQRAIRQIVTLTGDAGDDVVLLVLKGHLLVEERLNEILASSVAQPLVLQRANLRYHHLATFCEALSRSADQSWVWESIYHLNRLRNDLAHKLESGKRDQLIENFLKPIEEIRKMVYSEWKKEKGLADRLRSALPFLLGVLENYPLDRAG
jgi:hypothetical protein